MTADALAGFHDYGPTVESFREAVLRGLSAPVKAIPSRYIYDERGSSLFEAVCELDEYYPTRTEIALLRAHAGELAALIGPAGYLVEFGSGGSGKVRILLDACARPAVYVPVDISRATLRRQAGAVAADYPRIRVIAVCADFTKPFPLPEVGATELGRRVGFFPGTTIGNFMPDPARAFLSMSARMLAGGGLVIGVDLKKDATILEAAYNDSQGISAAFNLNLLERIKRELGGELDLDGFRHRAVYDPEKGRMDIGILSTGKQSVRIGGQKFTFERGEIIRTQVAYKFTVEGFQALARQSGFVPERAWCDDDGLFSIHYLRAP